MDEVTKAINHFSVLMEDQNAKLDAVLEGINSLPTRDDFHRLEQRLDTLGSDLSCWRKVNRHTVARGAGGHSLDDGHHDNRKSRLVCSGLDSMRLPTI